MAKKTTAVKAATEKHTHADLEKKVAALEKEVATLKKELAKAKGGADPRVEILLNHLLERKFLSENFCKNSGLL